MFGVGDISPGIEHKGYIPWLLRRTRRGRIDIRLGINPAEQNFVEPCGEAAKGSMNQGRTVLQTQNPPELVRAFRRAGGPAEPRSWLAILDL